MRPHAAAIALEGDAVVVGVWAYGGLFEGVTVRFNAGVVAGVTREGRVLTWVPAYAHDGSPPRPLPDRASGVWVIPAADYDIEAVIAAAREHRNGFSSHAELLAAISGCKKTEGDS